MKMGFVCVCVRGLGNIGVMVTAVPIYTFAAFQHVLCVRLYRWSLGDGHERETRKCVHISIHCACGIFSFSFTIRLKINF